MSKLELKPTFQEILTLMLLVGVLCVTGSLIFLIIGTMLDHSWLASGLVFVFPFLVIGMITIWLSSKLMEILD